MKTLKQCNINCHDKKFYCKCSYVRQKQQHRALNSHIPLEISFNIGEEFKPMYTNFFHALSSHYCSCYITFDGGNLLTFINAGVKSLIICFPRGYLVELAPALLTNIRLGLKRRAVMKTPRVNPIKRFMVVIYGFS